jgi:hypothetical protein
MHQDSFGAFTDSRAAIGANSSAPISRNEARDAVNELFRRAMTQGDGRKWMRGLFTFIAGMRRYSIFNAKLIYLQRPGAIAVGTAKYWTDRGRTIRPGAMPIVVLTPRGPFTLVYEYEDTEGREYRQPQLPFTTSTSAISGKGWERLNAGVAKAGVSRSGKADVFRVVEEGLGHGRHGDVHHARDSLGRFIIRINRNLDAQQKWSTLVHEVAHVCCGHCGKHEAGWWPDRRILPGIHKTMQKDIREFEAEAVVWLVASRVGIQTDSADYLASRVAPLDNERVDLEAILRTANYVESLAGRKK